jgi:methylmalonyl-CoA mutase N-terminal domain/subunit
VPAPDYSALAEGQRARLAEVRQRRPAGPVRTALDALRQAAHERQAALMPSILEAVRARATVGEISDVLREVWGEYRPT